MIPNDPKIKRVFASLLNIFCKLYEIHSRHFRSRNFIVICSRMQY